MKAQVEEEALLVAVHEIRTNNNRKISPMEDMVTLEAGGAKEDVVYDK